MVIYFETKLSTSYFIFDGKIALWAVSYVAEMLAAKKSMIKMLRVKIADMVLSSTDDSTVWPKVRHDVMNSFLVENQFLNI